MAMDHEIHVIFLEHVEACLSLDRLGRAKEDVRYVRAHHGTTPAVSESCAHGAQHDVIRFLVHAHRGTVHHLDHFSVNGTGRDAELLPDLLALLGGAGQVRKLSPLLAELFQEFECHLLGNFVHGFAFYVDTEITGHAVEFANVFNLQILGLPARYSKKGIRQIPRMVRVCCGTGSDHACEVPRRHHRQRCATHAHSLIFFSDETAGAHMAHFAAGSLVADGAGL